MAMLALSRVEEVFQAALAARAEGRDPDLTALCEGDRSLRDEVESLLEHFDHLGGDPDAPAAPEARVNGNKPPTHFLSPTELHGSRQALRGVRGDALLEEWGASAVGQRVGGFTLIGELGKGGMGVVFVAEQDHPRRTVALKLIRRDAATPAMIRRFEREAHLLGRLNHPGIAQVYAAGVAQIQDDAGSAVRAPYIAMELVDGPTIRDFVRARGGKGVALTLSLIAEVCDAIQHAHQRGVIHRDLKPANILVCFDEASCPHAKVLDFGIARDADDRRGDALTRITGQGNLIGTLAYMSPEQARSSATLDTRCDVYSIGAILYELLSGKPAIDVADCALPEAARRIHDHEPVRLGTLDRACRGDVETIVAKSLMKDPARRYQSPAEMAADIRSHLAGTPIGARRDSLGYVLARQVARYRRLALVAGALLGLAVGAELYVRHEQQLEARRARDEAAARIEAEQARQRADRLAADLAAQLTATRIAQARTLAALGDFDAAERLLRTEWRERPDNKAVGWAMLELRLKRARRR